MLRSNLAHAGLASIMTYLSEMTKEEVKDWVVWTCAARLGELVYKEPCPPGYSLVKGAPNFKVHVLDLCKSQFNQSFSSAEAERLTYDTIHD